MWLDDVCVTAPVPAVVMVTFALLCVYIKHHTAQAIN